MSTNNSSSNARGLNKTVARAGDLSAGTTKHYPNATDTLAFGGAKYTVKEVQANLAEIETLRTATTDAQSNATAKVAAEKARLPTLLAFMSAYVAFVKATYGDTPDVLADFGLAPKKAPRPLTPEQKAAAKAKRKATRVARGTKGPVAKLATVGNVIGVTVTPITAPVAAAPAPQPAAGSSTGTTGTAGGSAPATGGAGASGTAPHS
jgi:hypothetical protein